MKSSNSKVTQPPCVAVGKIVRTHGVKGAVKIFPYGETVEHAQPGTVFQLHPGASELVLAGIRPQGRHLIATFTGITSINDAEFLTGHELFLPENMLPATAEGEYYHYQLLGLTVETIAGEVLGTLSSIFPTGSNDVYVVVGKDREILIPAIEEVVLSVDLLQGKMKVDLPYGLIDDF